MKDNKVDFDLSILSLKELIEVYNNMNEFIQFLNDNKVLIEEVKDE